MMPMLLRRWRRLIFAVPFVLSLLACSCGGTQSIVVVNTPAAGTATTTATTDGGSGTPAAGDTPAPATPIPASIANCNQIGTFASAGAATAGSGFGDVAFPSNSLSVGAGSYSDTYAFTTYQFRLISACSNGSSVSAIQNFFASALTTGGWNTSTTFPFQGNPTRACGDPYCWRNGGTPVRYVGLENVQASGSVAVYTLRVGTAPTPSAAVVIRQNTILTGGSNQTASASCQSNEQLLSGGFLAHNPAGDPPTHASFTPDASYPSAANTWSVRSGALGYALNLTAYALCLQANYSVGVQIVHNHLTIPSSLDVQAACPSGSVPTGGGFGITPGGDSGRADKSIGSSTGWDADFRSGSTSTVDVWALCATHAMQSVAQNELPFTIIANGIAQWTHICVGGGIVTGGGFNDVGVPYLNDYGSYPDGSDAQWIAVAWNESPTTAFTGKDDVTCNTLHPSF